MSRERRPFDASHEKADGFCIPFPCIFTSLSDVVRREFGAGQNRVCRLSQTGRMSIYLTYDTALRFWDLLGRPPKASHASCRLDSLSPGKPDLEDFDRLRILAARLFGARSSHLLAPPLDIVVGRVGDRVYQGSVACHLWSGAIPAGSFQRVGSGLFVATPEHCFLERTRRRHDSRSDACLDVVRTGFYVCGDYALLERKADDEGLSCRLRLSTPRALGRYLGDVEVRGTRLAADLLEYVVEGSASPRETALAMQLVLPHRLGGFHLAKPLLNYRVDIPRSLRTQAGPRSYRIDLCYPRARVAVEYDGLFHSGLDRIARDARRRNDLEAMGWRTIVVTARQLGSFEEMTKVAREIASCLGGRMRIRSSSFPASWDALCRYVLPRYRI